MQMGPTASLDATGEEKNLPLPLKIEQPLVCTAHSLVTVLTELSQLLKPTREFKNTINHVLFNSKYI
jgi:hypothetical protein